MAWGCGGSHDSGYKQLFLPNPAREVHYTLMVQCTLGPRRQRMHVTLEVWKAGLEGFLCC